MSNKRKIALIYGGDSSEVEISIKSGQNVSTHFDSTKFDLYHILLRGGSWRVLNPSGGEFDLMLAYQVLNFSLEAEESGSKIVNIPNNLGVEIDKTDFSFIYNGEKIGFDAAHIMIHGTPGENGLLQGYFEMLKIPHNTCSAYVSAMTFSKHSCKRFLSNSGVKMAKDYYLNIGESYSSEEIVEQLGLPLFVKPCNGGSSFGVTKVKRVEELDDAINLAFKENGAIIIEEFISGREVTNGVWKTAEGFVKMPVTEIITTREFFDYEAKYLGDSKEVCPAELSAELTSAIQDLSLKIYEYFGCNGLVRVDYIIKGEDIYFLEVNTVPGMTQMSLIPQQVVAAGIDIKDLISNTLYC